MGTTRKKEKQNSFCGKLKNARSKFKRIFWVGTWKRKYRHCVRERLAFFFLVGVRL